MRDLYFAFCQGDILLTADGRIPEGEAPVTFQPWEKVTSLHSPLSTLHPITAHIYRLDSPVVGRPDLQMMGLRKTFDILPPEMYQLAGKCAELVYWDQNSKFCGCCGAPMRWDTEISKRCTECGKELWPQLATAIIVRVTRNRGEWRVESGERNELSGEKRVKSGESNVLDLQNNSQEENVSSLHSPLSTLHPKNSPLSTLHQDHSADEVLLVRAHNFRGDYYGLVAGFVETGETLEECVRREVWEETHIRVKNIRYFASQPWPYPAGLMVGFTAEYESGELTLQRSELAGGGWFRRDNLPAIPGPVSLARRLLDDWIKQTIDN